MLTLALPVEDPYSFTNGHWLHQDELQRKARYLQFDFSRLCETAIGLSEGASRVTSYENKEGGYNRVVVLTMDTGKRVVARITTRVAGPPRLTTNSEVATIEYRTNPAVYDEWTETAKESERKGGDMTVERADKLWPFF